MPSTIEALPDLKYFDWLPSKASVGFALVCLSRASEGHNKHLTPQSAWQIMTKAIPTQNLTSIFPSIAEYTNTLAAAEEHLGQAAPSQKERLGLAMPREHSSIFL